MAIWRSTLAIACLSAWCGASNAQGTYELFLQPQFDDRFTTDNAPKLPYGADIGQTLQPLEGRGAVIGVPQGGNVRVINVDPLANSDFGRALRAQDLTNALKGSPATDEPDPLLIPLIDQPKRPDAATADAREVLRQFEVQRFNRPQDLILNLTPEDATRFSALAGRLGSLSAAEELEYQQRLERGLGNPDPGTPTQPVRWPFTTPTTPVVIGGSPPQCDPPPEAVLMCKYLDPKTENYAELCGCSG